MSNLNSMVNKQFIFILFFAFIVYVSTAIHSVGYHYTAIWHDTDTLKKELRELLKERND